MTINNKSPHKLNLIQLINSPSEAIIKLSQSGSNSTIISQKIEAMRHHASLEMIDAKSILWKKIADTELDAEIVTAPPPKITFPESGILNLNDEWSGVMKIQGEAISINLDSKLRNAGVVFAEYPSVIEDVEFKNADSAKTNSQFFETRMDALVSATANHGAFLFIPEGLKTEKPFKISIIKDRSSNYLPLQFRIDLRPKSRAEILIELKSECSGESTSFIPAIIKIRLGESSALEFVEFQNFEKSVNYFSSEVMSVGENATLNRFIMDMGSHTTQRTVIAEMEEANGQAQVTGVYNPTGSQKFIYDTRQNHLASATNSSLLFKGVLDDDAFCLWKGNIFVKKGIRGADGFQLNNTLLLSTGAHAESIPGLEIIAEDVKCSHGVTMSTFDADQLFYLQARGISTEAGKELIVDGFLNAATSIIKNEKISAYINQNIKHPEAPV